MRGVDFAIDYYQYLLGDPVGQTKGFAHIEGLTLDSYLDFEKLAGTPGLSTHVGLVLISGNNLESKTGNAFPLMSVYGARSFFVSNAYLKQEAFDGGLRFKVGRVQWGDDFLTSDLRYSLVSLAFRSQIGVYINTPASGYPYATWGTSLRVRPRPFFEFTVGAYAADEDSYKNKYHGLDLSFNAQSGAHLSAECTYYVGKGGLSGHRGAYKIGTFYFTGHRPLLDGGVRVGNWATYLSVDQNIFSYRSSRSRGLSAFGTCVFFPKDRNALESYGTIGLVSKGTFVGRPEDTISLGYARGGYSQRLPQNNFEGLLELNYWMHQGWIQFTPMLQYVIKPQGLDIPNAVVLSAQLILSI